MLDKQKAEIQPGDEEDQDDWSKALTTRLLSLKLETILLVLLDILLDDDHRRDEALGNAFHDSLDGALVPVELLLL